MRGGARCLQTGADLADDHRREPARRSGRPHYLLLNLIGSDWSDTDRLAACRKPASRQSQHGAPFHCGWDSVYVSGFIGMKISLKRIKTAAI